MTDVEAISDLLSRYCHAIDDRDFDALKGLLTEDIRFEIGPDDVVEGRTTLLASIQENLWPPGRHLTVNHSVRVDGDTAHADSDWVWLNPKLVPERIGRYSDDFRREGGQWRFAVRRIAFVEPSDV